MSSPSEFHSQIATDFDDLYQKSPDFVQRYEVWTRLMPAYIPTASRALDLGCGSGIFSFFLAQRGATVLGIDGAANMIALCQQRKEELGLSSVRFQRAELPLAEGTLPANTFDAVISSSVLEYIEDIERVLRDVHLLLSEGGILVLSMPNRRSLYRMAERWLFRLTGRPRYYQYVRHVVAVETLDQWLLPLGFQRLEVDYYANQGKWVRWMRGWTPKAWHSNLWVAVYKKH